MRGKGNKTNKSNTSHCAQWTEVTWVPEQGVSTENTVVRKVPLRNWYLNKDLKEPTVNHVGIWNNTPANATVTTKCKNTYVGAT